MQTLQQRLNKHCKQCKHGDSQTNSAKSANSANITHSLALNHKHTSIHSITPHLALSRRRLHHQRHPRNTTCKQTAHPTLESQWKPLPPPQYLLVSVIAPNLAPVMETRSIVPLLPFEPRHAHLCAPRPPHLHIATLMAPRVVIPSIL